LKRQQFIIHLISILSIYSFLPVSADVNFPYDTLWQKKKELIVSIVEEVVARNLSFVGFNHRQTSLMVFDFDHTLVDTRHTIPVLLGDKTIREVDSKCMGKLLDGEIADYSVFNRQNLGQSKPIEPVIQLLKQSSSSEYTASAVITARSQNHNYSSILEYLAQLGAEPNVIYPIHSEFLEKNLWNHILIEPIKKLPPGIKKAIVIAGIIESLQRKGTIVNQVSYYEDTDNYLREAMLFLPKIFPKIKFQFFDVIRTLSADRNKYTIAKVAYSENGIVFDLSDKTFDSQKIAEYDSNDCKD
jgi:hypothetical protein